MRILLIVLLLLSAIATTAALLQILALPGVSLTLKAGQLLYSVGALIAAIMLMRRSTKAFAPYLIGFALLVGLSIADRGRDGALSYGFGFVILALFFLPSIRNSQLKAPPEGTHGA